MMTDRRFYCFKILLGDFVHHGNRVYQGEMQNSVTSLTQGLHYLPSLYYATETFWGFLPLQKVKYRLLIISSINIITLSLKMALLFYSFGNSD